MPRHPALLVAKADGTLLLRLDLAHRRVVSIGRSPRCDLTLAAPAVSRRHALLFRHSGGWRIVETGSRNGLHGPEGRAASLDLDERTWCRIGPAHLWLDPGAEHANHAAGIPFPDPDESQLLEDPDREPGPVLSLVDGRDRPLRRVALREHDGLLAGSAPACDLVIADPRVAPLQAIFYREHSRWCVVDASGTSSLFVEGRRTRRQRLHGGMLLTLGDHRLVVSGRVGRPTELADLDGQARDSTERTADWAVVGLVDDGGAESRAHGDPDETDAPDAGQVSTFLDPPRRVE